MENENANLFSPCVYSNLVSQGAYYICLDLNEGKMCVLYAIYAYSLFSNVKHEIKASYNP